MNIIIIIFFFQVVIDEDEDAANLLNKYWERQYFIQPYNLEIFND